MAKVKTSTVVSYDSVNPNKTANIVVDMSRWIEDATGVYYAEINYHIEIEGVSSFLKNKTVQISQEVFNMLYVGAESGIDSELTPYEKRELRKELALLNYIKNDFIDEDRTKCIFNTVPDIWVRY